MTQWSGDSRLRRWESLVPDCFGDKSRFIYLTLPPPSLLRDALYPPFPCFLGRAHIYLGLCWCLISGCYDGPGMLHDQTVVFPDEADVCLASVGSALMTRARRRAHCGSLLLNSHVCTNGLLQGACYLQSPAGDAVRVSHCVERLAEIGAYWHGEHGLFKDTCCTGPSNAYWMRPTVRGWGFKRTHHSLLTLHIFYFKIPSGWHLIVKPFGIFKSKESCEEWGKQNVRGIKDRRGAQRRIN